MHFIILINTTRRKNGAMNTELMALISEVQSANHIRPDRLRFIILAPVNVGPSRASRRIQDVRWLYPLELVDDLACVFHADHRCVDLLALALEKVIEMAGYPAVSAPDEKTVRHDCVWGLGKLEFMELDDLLSRMKDGERIQSVEEVVMSCKL